MGEVTLYPQVMMPRSRSRRAGARSGPPGCPPPPALPRSASGFRVQGSGCRVQGSGFRVQGSGFRVQGSGFRVKDKCRGGTSARYCFAKATGLNLIRRPCLVANRATLPQKWPPNPKNLAVSCELTEPTKPTQPSIFRGRAVHAGVCRRQLEAQGHRPALWIRV